MTNKRLLAILEESKKYILLHVLTNWVCLLCNILFIVYLGNFLQAFLSGGHAPSTTARFLGSMAVLIAVRFFCCRLAAHFSFMASAKAKKKLRRLIYQKLLGFGPSYSEKVSTAEVVQVAVEGIEQLEVYFGRYLPQLLYSLFSSFTLFVVISFINLKTALVMLACVPLIPISIMVVHKFAGSLFNKYWGVYTDLGDVFLENLQGLTTLKIYQADGHKNQEMNQQAESFRKITMKVLTMQLNSITVMDLVAFGGAAAGVLLAVTQFAAGSINLAGALIIILLASEFFIPVRMLGSYFHIAMNGMAAANKIFRLLDLEEAPIKSGDFQSYAISLDRVSFSYDHQRQILHEVSMDIPEGRLVALVGESGSGKSTVAALITGQRSYSGSIQIGGEEVSDLNEERLMKNVTLVSHNSYIFKGTIEENLKMGNPQATSAEMLGALKKVRLYDFVLSQEGLATLLQENGSNLSGGQRQRLALARALLHDSRIYIFDEATSNIDAESEEDIVSVILELAKHKTVILISHRLANVIRSDYIYLLDHGRVAEQGTHQELMKKNCLYAALFAAQADLEAYAGEEEDLCMQVQ